jgi:hypothetical protein
MTDTWQLAFLLGVSTFTVPSNGRRYNYINCNTIYNNFKFDVRDFSISLYIAYIYCDMSSHCWVTQPVPKHQPVNKISAQTQWRHATALDYGSYATCHDDVTRTRRRRIPRDLRVSASDVTQPSPGSLLRYGPGNRQQWRSYDWGLYKRNWNV